MLYEVITPAIGESMFTGKIFTRDPQAEEKMGGNVIYDEITIEEAAELDSLFAAYGFEAKGAEFHVIRPILDPSGKHKYVLFKPELNKEGAAKYKASGRNGGCYGAE